MSIFSKLLSIRSMVVMPSVFSTHTFTSDKDDINLSDFYGAVGVIFSVIPALMLARHVKDGGLQGLLDFMKKLNRRRIKPSYRFNFTCKRRSLKSNHFIFSKKRTNKN